MDTKIAKTFSALMGELEYQDEMSKDTSSHVIPEFPLSAGLVAIRVNLNLASDAWYNSRAPHTEAMEYIRKIGAICIRMGTKYGMPPRTGDYVDKRIDKHNTMWDKYVCHIKGERTKTNFDSAVMNGWGHEEADFKFNGDVSDMDLSDPAEESVPLKYVYSPSEGVGTIKHFCSFHGPDGLLYHKGNVSFFVDKLGQYREESNVVHGVFPAARCFDTIPALMDYLIDSLVEGVAKAIDMADGDKPRKEYGE